jgi:hypothetical protein
MQVSQALNDLLEDAGEEHLIFDPLVIVLEREQVLQATSILQRHHDPQLLLRYEAAVVLKEVRMAALGHDSDLFPYIILKLAGLFVLIEVDGFNGNFLAMARVCLIVNGASPDETEVALADTVVSLIA